MSDQLVLQIAVFTFIGLLIVVPILAHHWSVLRIKEWEMSLKHALVERGMSAGEIERILKATTSGGPANDAAEEAGEQLERVLSKTSGLPLRD